MSSIRAELLAVVVQVKDLEPTQIIKSTNKDLILARIYIKKQSQASSI